MQRVLVIDDDPAVTSVLKRRLVYQGYSVDTAANGAQGLAIARDHVPDLVILDVMLPRSRRWASRARHQFSTASAASTRRRVEGP